MASSNDRAASPADSRPNHAPDCPCEDCDPHTEWLGDDGEETEHIAAIRAWGIRFLEALKERDVNG